MLSLVKHFMRVSLPLRLTAFFVMLGMNVLFVIWTAFSGSLALHIVGLSLSGCALFAMIILQILADAALDKRVFNAPHAYTAHLLPVSTWKILLARTLCIAVPDALGLALGIAGETYLALKLSGSLTEFSRHTDGWTYVVFFFTLLLGYALIVLAIGLMRALNVSVFYGFHARSFLSAITTLAVIYAMSFMSLLLAPFGHVWRLDLLCLITLEPGVNVGTFAALLLGVVQCAFMLWGSSKLMEKKLNI